MESGERERKEIVLTPLATLNLTADVSHGFDPSEKVYIDGEPWEYYGSPLKVKQIGMVGKKMSLNRSDDHTISVGSSERAISISENVDQINVLLKGGKIIIER